ncbi:muconolactone delta-isomerase [Aeromicrobium camelliae]|uniref:Muconolactone delta-isomerase n=2 Tax=Aeromicrobium camelliae TaxID=1538144 RepID=A0A3N6ZG47_9ACTN|nr:muconolactone delta-isomerase [Aeromicrobium camelliae]
MELDLPADIGSAEFEALRAAEARRATELASEGFLVRLWRPPAGGWRNIGLWRAADEAELQHALSSLPLWPWITATVTALNPHGNDPLARP